LKKSLKELESMIAWGQYIHWSHLQTERHSSMAEEYSEAEFFGSVAHCLASQYIVIEGWQELNMHDEYIETLLAKYEDYVDIFRRSRNAVYHYQHKMIDKRIGEAMGGKEHLAFIAVLQMEFERFWYTYPYHLHGVNTIAQELHDEYIGCIGWEPPSNPYIRKLKLRLMVKNYHDNNERNVLEINSKNDKFIEDTVNGLSAMNIDQFKSLLSRL